MISDDLNESVADDAVDRARAADPYLSVASTFHW